VHVFDPGIQSAPTCPSFAGVRLYREAIAPGEAERLLATIDATPFVPSQSGKQKQHFGPRFNFMKRRMNAQGFDGLPAYAHALEARLRACVERDRDGSEADRTACRAALDTYETTDAFVLRYFEREQSNLDFHVDDLHAYGEAILDVSLESDAFLTFLGPFDGLEPAPRLEAVRVPLPARSIAVVHGPARFAWQHAILPADVRGVRTSITLRTLAPTLRATEAGRQVLSVAGRIRT
jgi:alkylated DNA repair protein alkB family protein 4